MIVNINHKLTVEGELHTFDNSKFLEGFGQKIQHVTHSGIDTLVSRQSLQYFKIEEAVNGPFSKLYVSAHNAFEKHANLSISPEVFWYAIVHEVAILVKSKPGTYGHLFTKNPSEVVMLTVRDDNLVYGSDSNDWGETISKFEGLLRQNMENEIVDLFLPQFSTSSEESDIATLVSFMDTVSKYYKFSVLTLCGIPNVQINGTLQDWQLLVKSTEKVSGLFPELYGYFEDLIPVLKNITATLSETEIDLKFWKSIYKVNSQSGGDRASGWLTALSAYTVNPETKLFQLKPKFDWKSINESDSGFKIEHFPAHFSTVPFIWDYLGNKINMKFFAGIIGVGYIDKFLTPQLGFGVAESS